MPPSQKRKLLPHALDVVMATALAPEPEDRYQDAVAFAEALRQVAHRHGLGFSAPQLAEHLRHILGRDPDQWLSDDKAGAVRRSVDAEDREGAGGQGSEVNRRGDGGRKLVRRRRRRRGKPKGAP